MRAARCLHSSLESCQYRQKPHLEQKVYDLLQGNERPADNLH